MGHIKQTFYFTAPFTTTKVRLDEFDGASEIAFKVEFIGLDRDKKNSLVNPMRGGYVTTSKKSCYGASYSQTPQGHRTSMWVTRPPSTV